MKFIIGLKNYIFIKIKNNKALFVIFVIALLYRWVGSSYGLPIVFSTDEPSFVRSAYGLRFSPNLNRFDWPHTNMYLHFAIYMVFYYFRVVLQVLHLKNFVANLFPIIWSDPSVFYLISRLVTGFFGAATVFPLYLSTKQLLKSKKLALFTVTLFIFIPYHVFDSHMALLDTTMTFWVSWFLYYTFKILDAPDRTKYYVLSGLFMGLAFGTKYNAFLYYFVFAICLFYAFYKGSFYNFIFSFFKKRTYKNIFLNIFAFFTSYLATNPTVFTDFSLFWSHTPGRGFLFQFDNVGSISWIKYPTSLYENMVTQSLSDFGFTLYVTVAIIVVLFLIFNYRNKITVITVLFPFLMYLYISKKQRNPSHYFEFLYPLIAIFVIYSINILSSIISNQLSNIKKKSIPFVNIQKNTIFIVLFCVIMFSPIINSSIATYKFSRLDTRNIALTYIKEYVKDVPVYYYGEPLKVVPFKNINAFEIKRLDGENIDVNKIPYYLVIGVNGVNYDDLMVGKRNHDFVHGRTSTFLKQSDLVSFISNYYRFGPNVFIFKINSVVKLD
ncbi:hypothetical protein COV24_01990 [candidate division WWE3 bacterium CG10_big_fil_rev_8_21_14_0_10_32_10]|uniref:Glycosyltransferase RgtA/B/C/D-like domain-containing protein n=1 Tax=candidate division WWE3 bacterium CG10_big_fil_rev_8_21_14_0_10_32_10 TaxID=1975090 RepID=A0A2H0RAL5_UNCKA|nr:MAG: hypothetical protein COV24_01990 [candidate division WWE3 bacterium CG10_big_fil_rev_8_21_14_0_10_32_10]